MTSRKRYVQYLAAQRFYEEASGDYGFHQEPPYDFSEAELRIEAEFRCWLHTIDLQNCPNTLPMGAALRGMADAWDWLHGPYQWWAWPVLSTCNQCSPDHVCANCHSMLRYCYLSDEWWNH